jgi:glyoxylase-like metal-dependent hydrolase (beta-lactamase superfamily II)
MKILFRTVALAAVLAALATLPFAATGQQKKPPAPKSLRLYILDCGDITGVGEAQFGFKPGQLADSHMVTPCYLIVHPRGTMMWDTGEIPDADFKGNPTKAGAFTVTRPLLPQLAALGYTPANINYLALSHYHGDHVANANSFAGSTWIVEEVERTAMFAKPNGKAQAPGTAPDATLYAKLEHSKTILLHGEDHDVFGDGTVVIKFTPGHTPGHQSLFLKFAKTGPVVLSGDLYHYPEERSMGLVPGFDVNAGQTRKSRADLETFLKKSGAQLWIQHGTADNAKLKKAPEYYE